MQYRLVYDVLNDGPPWGGVVSFILLLLFATASLLEIVARVRGRSIPPVHVRGYRTSADLPFGFVTAFGLIMIVLAGLCASYTYKAFALRTLCQKWDRAGQYQLTEGTVADYRFRKRGSSFRVADQSFDLLSVSAGFRGRFNIPGAPEGSLADGMRVRLAHREGIILRVEIAAEPMDGYRAMDTSRSRPIIALGSTVGRPSSGRGE
jgi:hypothetical protein